MAFILFDHIDFTYPAGGERTSPTLADIHLTIEPGEFVAIIGENGSGKSTLARHFNGLLLPDSGRVLVNGMDTRQPENLKPIREQIGMVFQRPQDQVVASTVAEDVAFGPCNLGLPARVIRERVDDALHAVGLDGFNDRPAYMLSAGEMQRLALAGVLAMQPRCIIFDETTALLDPLGREMVMRQAIDLHNKGITVILITHMMEEAACAERLVVLHRGRIAADSTPREVFSSSRLLQEYGLGIPEAMRAADVLRTYFPGLPAGVMHADELLSQLPSYPGSLVGPEPGDDPESHRQGPISVIDLSYTYMLDTPLAHRALDHANLHVSQGSTHGLIGATGSGKSTLLQHLNGLFRPQSGKVEVLGMNLGEAGLDTRFLRRQAALSFQQPEEQIFEQYVGDEIAYAARQLGSATTIRDAVRAAMAAVGLDFDLFKDRLTATLSGGERRKVALASALIVNPKVLLLDEPLAGLDPGSRQELSRHLGTLHKQGVSMVICTHQYEDLIGILDGTTVMSAGRDRMHGSPGNIFSDTESLAALKLQAPLAARLAAQLRANGWPLPHGIITLTQLTNAVSGIQVTGAA